ncbi:MAG: hypothetical protein Q9182_002344 [Xanthomendoza sp. 2 TL-2023]
MQPKALLPVITTVVSLTCTVLGFHADHRHGSLSHRQLTPQVHSISPPPSRHGTLNFTQTANVTRVLVNNPPINLLTTSLISDLYDFLLWTQPGTDKTTPKVVIFSSAIPGFFIAHFDLKNLLSNSSNTTAPANTSTSNELSPLLKLVHCGRLLQNTTSTAFIAEINGRTFGGGQELSSQMDMRFAGPNALIAQYENSNAFVAEAGGQLNLGPIIGKARAMEHLLASKTIDAKTGAQLGLFNTYFGNAGDLQGAVDALAARIGLFPQSSLNDTKFSLAFMSPTAEMEDAQLARMARIAEMEPWHEGVVITTLASSDESDNQFERNIPNSVVQALYGPELTKMGAKAKKAILDAGRTLGW